MLGRPKTWILLIVSMFLSGNMAAASCLQGEALYLDSKSNLTLQFTSLRQDIAVMHHFHIMHKGSDVRLTGYVLEVGEPERPFGIVQNNCPEGDVTGEELKACTVWEGVIYGVKPSGKLDMLPLAHDPALSELVLPDFAHSLMNNDVWEQLAQDHEPFEIFELTDCGAN